MQLLETEKMPKIPRGRGAVVHLNRLQKARMIEAIAAEFLSRSIKGLTILDIGCGNGGISAYFGKRNEQYGVDIKDQRNGESNNFRFQLVDSEKLPFGNSFFDLVISHHVIEHVVDQDLHLTEIRRVLKQNGAAYLATPNKSSPIMEGHINNEMVLRLREMRPLFYKNGFIAHEFSCELLKQPAKYHSEVSNVYLVPKIILKLLSPLFPSQIFMLEKSMDR